MIEIKQNWLNSDTIKYDFKELKELKELNLGSLNLKILSKVGLPRINTNYNSFFPAKELKQIDLLGRKSICLGNPFRENQWNDNIIILVLDTKTIHFYSSSFARIDYVPEPISFVNSDLSDFLFFQYQLTKFTEYIFNVKPRIKIKEVESLLNKLIILLNDRDEIGLGLERDYRLFWKRKINNLISDIEEFYDEFISISILNNK